MFERLEKSIDLEIHRFLEKQPHRHSGEEDQKIAREATINAVIEKLKGHDGVDAKVVDQNPDYTKPITISIDAKNSSGTSTYLGTFTIDFDGPELAFGMRRYTENFSNAIVRSFVSSFFKTNVLQTLTDDDFKFIAQFEALKKALAEKGKKAYKSHEEKNLCVAFANILQKVYDLPISDPEKTNALTNILTIFNKIIDGKASSEDINNLFKSKAKEEVTFADSPILRQTGIIFTVIGPMLLVAGIITSEISMFSSSTLSIFIPILILILGFTSLAGGGFAVVTGSVKAPLLNEDLHQTINSSGLVQKDQPTQKKQADQVHTATHTYTAPVPSTEKSTSSSATQITKSTQSNAPNLKSNQ